MRKLLARLLGTLVLYLGHGRALEAFLVGLKILVGVSIFLPHHQQSVPLDQLSWNVPEQAIAVPFLAIGLTQLAGLVMNVRGYVASWYLRLVGAGGAIGMWSWLIWECFAFGAFGPFTFPCSLMGLLASSYLVNRAVNHKPAPGAPGLV